MFTFVVEPIDGIQDVMVYGTWVQCYNSKWWFKTTKLTSSFKLLSHHWVLSLFAAGTCLHERTSQPGIATEDSTKNASNECECMDADPCFGGSAFGTVRGLPPPCVPHIMCDSRGHKFCLVDLIRMNSSMLKNGIPARGLSVSYLKYGITRSTVLCTGYVNLQSRVFCKAIG